MANKALYNLTLLTTLADSLNTIRKDVTSDNSKSYNELFTMLTGELDESSSSQEYSSAISALDNLSKEYENKWMPRGFDTKIQFQKDHLRAGEGISEKREEAINNLSDLYTELSTTDLTNTTITEKGFERVYQDMLKTKSDVYHLFSDTEKKNYDYHLTLVNDIIGLGQQLEGYDTPTFGPMINPPGIQIDFPDKPKAELAFKQAIEAFNQRDFGRAQQYLTVGQSLLRDWEGKPLSQHLQLPLRGTGGDPNAGRIYWGWSLAGKGVQ